MRQRARGGRVQRRWAGLTSLRHVQPRRDAQRVGGHPSADRQTLQRELLLPHPAQIQRRARSGLSLRLLGTVRRSRTVHPRRRKADGLGPHHRQAAAQCLQRLEGRYVRRSELFPTIVPSVPTRVQKAEAPRPSFVSLSSFASFPP